LSNMGFPYFEINFKTRKLENDKYKARCGISEHTGYSVNDFLSRWELSREYDSEDAANFAMRINATHYLKREIGPEVVDKIKLTVR